MGNGRSRRSCGGPYLRTVPPAYAPRAARQEPGVRRWRLAYARGVSSLPLPQGDGVVVVPAPAAGPQNWAGAPSAAYDEDGSIVLAYRLRWAEGPNDMNVIAWSDDGEHFETIVTLDKERWGAAMVERPMLVRLADGGWRLYVCCATPNSKHWWIGLLEAPSLEALADADVHPVFPGDETVGVKDPVIQRRDGRWHAWICCHPIDVEDEEDRMSTGYATSSDGLDWEWHGTVLAGRPTAWDARGARLTAVLPDGRQPTTAARPRRRTGSSGSGSRNGKAMASSRPGTPSSTRATSSSCRFQAVATACTTRPGSRMRATSCGRKLEVLDELGAVTAVAVLDAAAAAVPVLPHDPLQVLHLERD